jgi:hypothetical protein
LSQIFLTDARTFMTDASLDCTIERRKPRRGFRRDRR